MRVLFFGREGDDFSQQLAQFLSDKAELETVWSSGLANSLPDAARRWRGDIIVSFRSRYILPLSVLNSAALCAINFHPGPPEYPGSGCINWALYDNAAEYGATAHLMTERVDAGDILDVRRYPIRSEEDIAGVLERCYPILLEQACVVTARLLAEGRDGLEAMRRACGNERWRGRAKAMHYIDDLMRLDVSMPKEEIERRIRATRCGRFVPYIELHGRKFILSE